MGCEYLTQYSGYGLECFYHLEKIPAETIRNENCGKAITDFWFLTKQSVDASIGDKFRDRISQKLVDSIRGDATAFSDEESRKILRSISGYQTVMYGKMLELGVIGIGDYQLGRYGVETVVQEPLHKNRGGKTDIKFVFPDGSFERVEIETSVGVNFRRPLHEHRTGKRSQNEPFSLVTLGYDLSMKKVAEMQQFKCSPVSVAPVVNLGVTTFYDFINGLAERAQASQAAKA
jgi:hypothetical protein